MYSNLTTVRARRADRPQILGRFIIGSELSAFFLTASAQNIQMTSPNFDDPCPCGSGESYLHCHGKLDKRIWNEDALGRFAVSFADPQWEHFVASEPQCSFDGQLMPRGFLATQVPEDSGWPELARHLCEREQARDALVREGKELRKTVWRETHIVDQGAHKEAVLRLVHRAFNEYAEPFYKCKVRSVASPHILRYSTGGYYRPHADSDEFNVKTQKWEKTEDVDLSLLLYLDDDYEGGEINFPNFGFQLRPRAGMLLMFPSDCRYLHGVLPVTAGVRHSIVSWCNIHPRS